VRLRESMMEPMESISQNGCTFGSILAPDQLHSLMLATMGANKMPLFVDQDDNTMMFYFITNYSVCSCLSPRRQWTCH